MAAGGDTNCNITFSSKQTVKVGNGDAGEGVLAIPERKRLEKETINCLVDNIFPDIEQRYTDTKWLANRAILCPSNKEVDEVNEEVLRRLPGEERILKSIDTTEENSPEYTPEFLNSLEMSGIPPHLLKLKPGCIVILLRNMDSEAGHCNGVKYCVVNVLPHIIELRSVSGNNKGSILLLPRITCISKSKTLPFVLRRKQFPIKLAFALTANKVFSLQIKSRILDMILYAGPRPDLGGCRALPGHRLLLSWASVCGLQQGRQPRQHQGNNDNFTITSVLIFTLHYNQVLKRSGKSEKKRPSAMKNIVYKSVLV